MPGSEQDIAVTATKSKRILSFDLIRGFLLLVIVVGHVELPPNFYDFFTGRGRLFVSAAEGFFFMSGLLVGMVYKRRIQLGMAFIFKKMWRRAGELYLGSILMTLMAVFVISKTNHPYIKAGLVTPVDWPHTIIQTLLLRYEYGWADFLARFAILMLIAPFIFYLISKNRWRLVVIGMITAWFFRHQNFTLAWQIIFNSGMIIGFYWKEIMKWLDSQTQERRKLAKKVIIAVTVISFSLSYATVYALSELNNFYDRLPVFWQHFTLDWNRFTQFVWTYADKWTMGPLRLILFYFWAVVVFMWVSKREEVIDKRSYGIFKLLGQNSLFVYVYHAFIILAFKFFIPSKTHIWQNFVITSLALVLLIGGTLAYNYLRLNWKKISYQMPEGSFIKKSKAILDRF